VAGRNEDVVDRQGDDKLKLNHGVGMSARSVSFQSSPFKKRSQTSILAIVGINQSYISLSTAASALYVN
jgi:hypothetical protein